MTDLLYRGGQRRAATTCVLSQMRTVCRWNVRSIADRLGECEDFGALVLICEDRGARAVGPPESVALSECEFLVSEEEANANSKPSKLFRPEESRICRQ